MLNRDFLGLARDFLHGVAVIDTLENCTRVLIGLILMEEVPDRKILEFEEVNIHPKAVYLNVDK